jgi:hypothetical protein
VPWPSSSSFPILFEINSLRMVQPRRATLLVHLIRQGKGEDPEPMRGRRGARERSE